MSSTAPVDAPEPLRRVLSVLNEEHSNARRHHAAAFAAIEAAVRWLGILVLRSRATLGHPLDDKSRALAFLERPSLGKWVELVLRHGRAVEGGDSVAADVLAWIAELIASRPVGLEFGDLGPTATWAERLELLPSYRNDFVGHAGLISDEHFEEVAPQLEAMARSLFKAIAVFPFAVVVNADEKGVALTSESRPRSELRLDPLVVVDDAREFLLFDRARRRGGVDAIDFSTGTRIRHHTQPLGEAAWCRPLYDGYSRQPQSVVRGRVNVRAAALRARTVHDTPTLFRVVVENLAPVPVSVRLTVVDDYWRTEAEVCEIPANACRRVIKTLVPTRAGVIPSPTWRVEHDLGGDPIRVLTEPERLQVESDSSGRLTFEGDTPRLDGCEWKLVSGEPGRGKTAWLTELARRQRLMGARDLFVSARWEGASGAPFRDLLCEVLGLTSRAQEASALRARATDELTSYLEDEPGLVDYFVRLLLGEVSERVSDELAAYRWFRLLSAASSERPLTLLIDDFDRMDKSSVGAWLRMVSLLQQEAVPIAGAFTIRAKTTEIDETVTSAGVRFESFEVPTLGAASMEALIRAHYPRLDYQDDLPWLPNVLADESRGNTALAIAWIEHLDSESDPVVSNEGGQWKAKRLTEHGLSSRLRRVGRALDADPTSGLSENARLRLETATLLGSSFEVSSLVDLLGDEDRVDDALDELERSGFIEPTDDSLQQYRFLRASLPERIVEGLFARGRRSALKLARRVAEHTEELHAESAEAAGRLAQLWTRAGSPARAWPYLVRALAQACRGGRFVEARDWVERLEAIPPDTRENDVDRRLEELRCRGEVAIYQGRSGLDPAESLFRELAKRAEEARDHEHALVSRIKLAEIETRRSRLDAADRWIEEARRWVSDDTSPNLRATLLNTEGILRRHQGRTAEAVHCYREAIRFTDAPLAARSSWTNLGQAYRELGEFDLGVDFMSKGLELAERAGDLDLMRIALVGLANFRDARWEFDDARLAFASALETCRLLQNRRGLGRIYFNLAEVDLHLNRLDRARLEVERALEIRREINDRWGQALCLLNRACQFETVGEVDERDADLDDAIAILEEVENPELRRRVETVAAVLRGSADPEADSTQGPSEATLLLRGLARLTDDDPLHGLVEGYLSAHPPSASPWELVTLAATYLQVDGSQLQHCPTVSRWSRDGFTSLPLGAPLEKLSAAVRLHEAGVLSADASQLGARLIERRASAIEDRDLRERFIAARLAAFEKNEESG